MPNWVEGTFRAQGSKEDIKRFVMEGLQIRGDSDGTELWSFSEGVDYLEFNCKADTVWIADTRRQFLNNGYCLYAYPVKGDPKDHWRIVSGFQGAWCIDTEGLKAVSGKYNLRIKANGFEQGMRFAPTVEVYRGILEYEDEETYEDWDWDCPMPLMGG